MPMRVDEARRYDSISPVNDSRTRGILEIWSNRFDDTALNQDITVRDGANVLVNGHNGGILDDVVGTHDLW